MARTHSAAAAGRSFAAFALSGALFQFFATLMQATVATYFNAYMTDTACIGAGAASMIMLVACIWDLFADPAIGGIIERTESRWGRYRPYLLLSAPLLTAISFLLFFDISALSGQAKVVYLLVCYVLFGSVLTLYTVPTGAVISSTIGSKEQRNKAFMLGGIGVGAAFTVASTWSQHIARLFGDGSHFCWNMLLFGVPLCVMGWLYFRFSREDFLVKREKEPLRAALKTILRHRPVWSCLAIWVLSNLGYGLMFSSSVYYIKYVIASDMSQWQLVGTYMFVISIGALVSMALLQPLFLKLFAFDHNKAVMLSQGITLVCYVLLLFFGRISFAFLCIVSFVATACVAMTQALQNGYIADVIDYVQLKEGVTFGAVVNSVKSLATKVGSACANYGILAMLAATGYIENVVGEGQSAAAVSGINFFRFGLPALCCGLVFLLAACYPIRRHYAAIRTMKEAMVGRE